MSKPEVAVIWAVGLILLVMGLALQRRVLKRHGTEKARRAMAINPLRARPAWIDGEWFTTSEGLRRFLQAQALINIGVTIAMFVVGYVWGRGW